MPSSGPIVPRTGGYIPNTGNTQTTNSGAVGHRIPGSDNRFQMAEYGADKTKPAMPGKKNKIIWGDEVGPGTSGGNTSYNSETGKVQYISGYEQDGGESAPLAGLQNAGPDGPKKSSSSGSKGKNQKSAKKSSPPSSVPGGAPLAPPPVLNTSPPQTHDVPPAPPQVPIDDGGVGMPIPGPGGGGSMGGMQGPMPTTSVGGSGGGGIGGGPGIEWMLAPSRLRQGLGQRMLPNLTAPLAGLGRVVY